MNAILRNTFYKCSIIAKNLKFTPLSRFYGSNPTNTGILNVDTKVNKDVVLYKFEKVRQVRMLSAFGLGQAMFWNYWAHFLYTAIKDTPVDESKLDENSKWYDKINLGQNKYKIAFSAACLFVGNGMFLAAVLYARRCVNKIVLKRGGHSILLSVYTPWGGTSTFSTPLSNVSCVYARDLSKWSTPIKVKGHSFYYTLDNVGGKFNNVMLFDATVGLKRSLK
ncbi:transmembrane protein 223 [Nilaparvata lugens]|uniref:transmembrane protein 223 n=1 Tax=Nilaparvata lugens TaxID=108931 RepID=UPI00193EC1D7|nr:transmembrane protein 223 [Nilaparvata lugens]